MGPGVQGDGAWGTGARRLAVVRATRGVAATACPPLCAVPLPEERANRRLKQLQQKGFDVNFEHLLLEIRERDERDRNRPVAPLRPAEDALVIDSTAMDITSVLEVVLSEVEKKIGITA